MAHKNGATYDLPDIINPDFEGADPLEGWTTAGVAETGGYGGGTRLTHPGGKGPVETTQRMSNVFNGWYTLKAWVRSSGGQKQAYIALKDSGGERQATVPIVPSDKWMQIVVSAEITNHQCTISLYSEAEAGEWVSFDKLELAAGRAELTVRGADISSLKKSEDKGGLYAFDDGRQADALKILHNYNMNYARLRVWVNSPDGYHGKTQLFEMARRLKQNHIRLLVDFHYADSWADPGKQPKPAAWKKLDLKGLRQAVYDHTYEVCMGLVEQGTPPDMVQLGNEITNGMLWPDGRNDQSFENLAALLKAGYRAVKDCSPDTRVMLQLDNGGKHELYCWWFDHILELGVPFDLIGASYYPYWHGTLFDLQNNLNDIAVRYDKDIVIVETAYPFAQGNPEHQGDLSAIQQTPGYPFTPEGQQRMLADIMTIVRAIPNGRGLGVMWWDATWTDVPGNGWDPFDPASPNNWNNQALFDYDHRAVPALSLFRVP